MERMRLETCGNDISRSLNLNFLHQRKKKDKDKDKDKDKVDYDLIISELKKGPLTFSQIQALSGKPRHAVSQVITTLSMKAPVYEAARGLYKLYGADDYGDGINHAALKEYEDE